MVGSGFSISGSGFDRYISYANYGGDDQAVLYDTPSDDTLTLSREITTFTIRAGGHSVFSKLPQTGD
ncbi:MAG: hypothetical protein CMJ46_04295 [Planctomyces sp.]|nr:hypothetical protein [Planctomyces sp.]